MTIEETLQIALDAHKGQMDLDSKPAILHSIAVGIMGDNGVEIKAGFLHDVVEDSDLTLDDLRRKGVDDEVLAALELLTHDKTTNDIEKSERLAKINEKHQKALDIFEYMPLYDDGRSRDGQPVSLKGTE